MTAKAYDRRYSRNKDEFSAMRTTLGDWYGQNRCDREIEKRSENLWAVGDIVRGEVKSLLGPDTAATLLLREKFDAIMGDPLCRFTKLNSVKGGVVYIEVSHPAWLRELSGALKSRILDKLRAAAGEKVCRDVRFIPAGRG
ncbi:MAG: DUF721 domain-containing protein [Victivallaceae bacterium]|nr:DUF721 domain-containing protein [Victivallaceae bacterium]